MRDRQHRFLVRRLPDLTDVVPDVIMQGYLLNEDGFTVRVRRVSVPIPGGDEFGTVTITGPRNRAGERAREELVFDDVALAGQLLRRCRHKVLKRRYQVGAGGVCDVFDWENAGLVLAEYPGEVEQDSPAWLGREITSESVFNNEWLARRPWLTWSTTERGYWAT